MYSSDINDSFNLLNTSRSSTRKQSTTDGGHLARLRCVTWRRTWWRPHWSVTAGSHVMCHICYISYTPKFQMHNSCLGPNLEDILVAHFSTSWIYYRLNLVRPQVSKFNSVNTPRYHSKTKHRVRKTHLSNKKPGQTKVVSTSFLSFANFVNTFGRQPIGKIP